MPQVVFNTSIDIHDINIGSTKEGRLELVLWSQDQI
jgi:hypothetical protein